MNDKESLKKIAAEKAVESLKDGMIVGLGTGSTVYYALKKIGELLKDGKLNNIKGIPSSVQTEKLAIEFGIPITDFDAHQKIDLTIDGADEVDSEMNLIKGGGGALLREKILAQASEYFIVIVDSSKISYNLGTNWALPIEVIPFAKEVEKDFLESIGAKATIRLNEDGSPFVTDEKNVIIDANFGEIPDPESIAELLEQRAGIVENGLFIGMADKVIVAEDEGILELERA